MNVSLARCQSYTAGLEEAVSAALSELGGIGKFVTSGQSVLVKPNLLTDRHPDEAVTTHPLVVRALLRILKRHGAKICVADSPASSVKLERVWERTGFRSMCAEENVPIVNLEKAGSVPMRVDGYSFSIARPILEADVIINVPKVKTHVLTLLTAAVKNMYGAVPGYQKTNLHKKHPTPADFGRLMVEIYKKCPPHLNLADAVVGMDRDGPSAGRPVPLGFVAASADAVALDLAICRILGIRPKDVAYLRCFLKEDPETWRRIEILEANGTGFAIPGFGLPSTIKPRLIPRWLVRLLDPFIWIRPSFSDACVACGRCVKACPAAALELEDNTKPRLDTRKCIECCCCHEVCPEKAVSMTQSPLLNLVRRGKLP